jgi:hypothetical protein
MRYLGECFRLGEEEVASEVMNEKRNIPYEARGEVEYVFEISLK